MTTTSRPIFTSLLIMLAAMTGCSKSPTTEGVHPSESTERSASPANNVALSSDAARKAGIGVEVAGQAKIRTTLTLYGSIKSNAEREQVIRARYPGVVRRITKRAGDPVNQGEELLQVESNESLQVYAIRSPLSGKVLERTTNPGDAVDGSTPLMRVADFSTVWVEFAVFARDLGHVKPGMPVLFRDADGGGEATITYVAPAGHADSQSVVARAVIDNRRGRWVAGQFVTGDVVITDVQAPVTVQPTALQELRGNTVVFVQSEKGFEARPVRVGRRGHDSVEIIEGLAQGERYAARNSYLIKADLLKNDAEEE